MIISETGWMIVRYLTLISALFGIYSWIKAGKRYHAMGYVIAPVIWLVHVAIFAVYRIVHYPFDPVLVNLWSSVIHLQAVFTLSLAVYVAGLTRRRSNG